MEIIVDIREGENGRPVGTVRQSSTEDAIPFSGNLEFMALVERLYRTCTPLAPSQQHAEGEQK
jgi:hypothetical protein